jgi:hypothetical protein
MDPIDFLCYTSDGQRTNSKSEQCVITTFFLFLEQPSLALAWVERDIAAI